MTHLTVSMKQFLLEDSGQDLIEFALLLCVLGLGCLASMRGVATGVVNVFAAVGTQITGNI